MTETGIGQIKESLYGKYYHIQNVYFSESTDIASKKFVITGITIYFRTRYLEKIKSIF